MLHHAATRPSRLTKMSKRMLARVSETESVNRIYLYHSMLLSSNPAFSAPLHWPTPSWETIPGMQPKGSRRTLEIIVAPGEGSLEKHIRIIKLTLETKATFPNHFS